LIQSRGIDDLPFGVVELDVACVRYEVVGFIWRSGGLTIGSGSLEIDLDDLRVAIASFASDKLRAFLGGKVDRRFRFALGKHFIERGASDEFCRQRQKSGDTYYKKNNSAFHDCLLNLLI
jgi:hypothetical protein